MTIVPVNLGSKSQPDRYSPIPLYINCEMEDAGRDAQYRFPIYAKHGLANFATLTGGGSIRGMMVLGNTLYCVAGQKLFSVSSSGVVNQISGIPGTDRVYIAANRRADPQIVLVTNGLAYVLQNGVLSAYPDADLPSPIAVDFLNGNFVFFLSDGRMFSSELESTDIDPLDFATAEADRDNSVAGIVRGDDLINFGQKTTEYWRPDGGSNFPFARVATEPRGCMAGGTVARYNDTVFWVDDEGLIVASKGYQAQHIEFSPVERDIEDEPNKSDMMGFTYAYRGQSYYVLSGTAWTWVLNLRTGFWHKAESYGLTRWRGLFSVNLANQTIIGDRSTNKLYKADNAAYTEGGEHHVWTARVPLIHKYPARIELNELFLNLVPGQGDGSTNAANADPKVMLSTSTDGGNTYGAARLQSVGQQGQRNKQVKFTRFGTSFEDGFAFEISMSAAVAGGINGATADLEQVTP